MKRTYIKPFVPFVVPFFCVRKVNKPADATMEYSSTIKDGITIPTLVPKKDLTKSAELTVFAVAPSPQPIDTAASRGAGGKGAAAAQEHPSVPHKAAGAAKGGKGGHSKAPAGKASGAPPPLKRGAPTKATGSAMKKAESH